LALFTFSLCEIQTFGLTLQILGKVEKQKAMGESAPAWSSEF
jgi:hypothetical protein